MCTAINLVSRGIGESFAVFLLPLARDFRVERVTITGIYSVYLLTHGLASPAVGALFDRLGPRVVYSSGLTCFALAYLLAGAAESLWQLYLSLGIFAGVGTAALGMVPASTLVSRWFKRRLARAMAVLYAALGVGLLLFAPTSQWLIDAFGWRATYHIFGVVLFALLPILLFAPWRKIASGHAEYTTERHRARPHAKEWNLRHALRSPAFWGLSCVFFVTAVTTFAVNVQAVAYLVDVGFSALEAASFYGFAGVLSIFGMLGAGLLSERHGERRVATISYSCTILGIGALSLLKWYAMYPVLLAYVLLFGAMQGSRGPLIATLVARLFAGAGVGSIYGGLALAMGLGGAAGSWGAGLLHDLTGGYGAGFFMAALGAVTGIVLFQTIGSLNVRSEIGTEYKHR
ncbi:MAG: MFS transporter [Betaproteobacteria bacterium]